MTPEYFRLDLDWNDMLLNAGNAAPVLAALNLQPRIAIYKSPSCSATWRASACCAAKPPGRWRCTLASRPSHGVIRDAVCDGFVVSGGVAGVLRQGALAAAFEKPFWLQLVGTGLTTALSAHLGAALPFCAVAERQLPEQLRRRSLATPLTRSRAAVCACPRRLV